MRQKNYLNNQMLSIIIPTLNEEKYLSLLLESIKKQNFKDYEIIVADAGSKDGTVIIAKSYGCKVIKGGSPAKGRNEGAKAAKKDLLLFLDADMVLPSNFLSDALKKFNKKKLDIATFPIMFYGEEAEKLNEFISKFYNTLVKATQKFLPYASGGVLLVKKQTHQLIKGFDEEIKLAEDHIYAREARKTGKFALLETESVLTSDRRFKKDGRFVTCSKYFLANFYISYFGPIKSDVFKYKLNHYNEKK